MSEATEIKVNPNQLRNLASEIDKISKSFQTGMAQGTEETRRLQEVWTGEAATAFTTGFYALHNSCSSYLQTLEKTVQALYEAADAYEKSEKSIAAEAEKMPKLSANTMR